MDRIDACQHYIVDNPEDQYDILIHHIVDDYNIEDYWIFEAISNIAKHLSDNESDIKLRRQLDFLVSLLTLPLPDGWDDDE